MHKRFGLLAAGGLAVALVAGGGTALAAATGPESSSGVITGCYTNAAVNGSHAVVLQNGGTGCPSGTSAISWDQTGPQGPAGPAGSSIVTSQGFPPSPCTTGDTDVELTNGDVYTCTASAWVPTGSSIEGPQGPAGTGATVTQGAADCASGGVTVTDGSGNTAYVCNGATGAAGPPGTVSSLDDLVGIPCDSGAGTTQVSYASDGTVILTCATGSSSTGPTVTAYPYNSCPNAIDLNSGDTYIGVNVGSSYAYFEVTVESTADAPTVAVYGTSFDGGPAGSDVMSVSSSCSGSGVVASNITSYTFAATGTYWVAVTEGSSGADGAFEIAYSTS